MNFPKQFLEEHLNTAKGSTMFGILLEDLTKEELMACVVAGWEGEKRERERQSWMDNINGRKGQA